MPALPSWLADPLWDQFAALLPPRPTYVATHPWGCHRRRIPDRIVFDKQIQVLRFGCSYEAIADTTCSATTLRDRRDEWIALGVFAQLARIARESYDRIVGLLLDDIAVDGCITKAPGGGEVADPSPVDRRKQGMKRSVLVEGYGIPLGRVLAGAQRHDSPLLAPTLDLLGELGPLPEEITVISTPVTTPARPARLSPSAGCAGRSRTRARRRPSRPASVGMSSGPMPGTTRSTGSSAATNAARR